jgi:3-hydroxyacyl-[acyl-carrier-protein] dehydratase
MTERPVTGTSSIPIDIMRVMELIPHRFPFLMVDRIVELTLDEKAVGLKNVSINEPYFQGHFPRDAVMPGVLIIESMAQTAAVLVVETLEGAAAGKLVYFMTVDDARMVEVSKLRSRGNFWKFRGEARVDGTLVAEANFAAMIRDD